MGSLPVACLEAGLLCHVPGKVHKAMTFHVTSVQCDNPEIRYIGWRTLEIRSQSNPSCSMCLLGGFLHRQQVSRGDMTLPGWLFRVLVSSYRVCLRLGRCGREQTFTCLLVHLSSLFTPVFWRIRCHSSHHAPHGVAWSRLGPRAWSWNWGSHLARLVGSWAALLWTRELMAPKTGCLPIACWPFGAASLARPRGCGVVQSGSVSF